MEGTDGKLWDGVTRMEILAKCRWERTAAQNRVKGNQDRHENKGSVSENGMATYLHFSVKTTTNNTSSFPF